MVDKVFFMAFDPKHPDFLYAQYEYGSMDPTMDKNQRMIDHELAKGNTAVAVWYNGKKNPHMASLTDGQLYIRGHGMPGFRSIEGGRGGERISYDVLVDRLIATGLRKTFSGKVKCYNCHSAEPGVVGSDPEVEDGSPFARLVAEEMYSRGFKHCTYFGYFGAVDAFAKAGSQGTHKYSREVRAGTQVEVARARDARAQFYPTVKFKQSFFKRLFA